MDFAFGGLPDMESHAAYVYCAIGTLDIINSLNEINKVTIFYLNLGGTW